MALESPLMPSPPTTNLMSAFSPYIDSPSSPQPFGSPMAPNGFACLLLQTRSEIDKWCRSSDKSSNQYLQPNQTSPIAPSPSDTADPSPIALSSNATDEADIDDTMVETEDTETTPSLKPDDSDLKVRVPMAGKEFIGLIVTTSLR